MAENIVAYGYWRTGSNLFIDILQNKDFFNFDEYFGHVLGHVNPLIEDDQRQFLKTQLNNFYRLMISTNKVERSVVKVMFPHVDFIDDATDKQVHHRVLIHRSDFKQTIVSKIIAQQRGSWRSYVGYPDQPLYDSSINIKTFKDELTTYINEYNHFLNRKIDIDVIVDYDLDLVPYVDKQGTKMLKSNNYTIKNIDKIDEIYSKYESSVNSICERVLTIRDKKIKLSEFVK